MKKDPAKYIALLEKQGITLDKTPAAGHCHMTHHVMNQMGHGLPNILGINAEGLDEKIRKRVPGYMTMGQVGMGGMGDMGMAVPSNSIPMKGGDGPFGFIEMGGMFTILKVREGVTIYDDPGWFQYPAGSVARPATPEELKQDAVDLPAHAPLAIPPQPSPHEVPYRKIQSEYGMGEGGGGKPLSRGTISLLLHEAETLAKVRFLREQGTSMRKLVGDVTRTKRAIGMRSASRYDFHCLRTTFVTTALQKGLSETKLRALTGHTTVDLVIRHYFKPRGRDVASELEAVMPIALSGRRPVKPVVAAPPERKTMESLEEIMANLVGLTKEQRSTLTAMLIQNGQYKTLPI